MSPKKKIKNGDVMWKQSDLLALVEKHGAEEVARVFAAGGTKEDFEKPRSTEGRKHIEEVKAKADKFRDQFVKLPKDGGK